MKKLLLVMAVIAGLIGLFIVLRLWQDAHPSGEIGIDLTFGWIAFLYRVLPNVRIQWDGVAIFTGASLTLLLILHSFLSWLTTATVSAAEGAPKPRWRWKWTIALTAGVMAIFVAGISVVGVTHQSYWLVTSNEPLYGQDVPPYFRGLSENNLKQQALAIHNTVSTYKTFPSHWKTDEPRHSWVIDILPFLPYMDETDHQLPWDHPKNAKYYRAVLWPLLNPQFRTPPLRDRNGFGLNHYAGNTHLFDRTDHFTFDEAAQGGTANTLMFGEVNAKFVPWGQPENSRDPRVGIGVPEGFGGANPQGANFAMMDGSVRLVRKDIDPKVLSALSMASARQ